MSPTGGLGLCAILWGSSMRLSPTPRRPWKPHLARSWAPRSEWWGCTARVAAQDALCGSPQRTAAASTPGAMTVFPGSLAFVLANLDRGLTAVASVPASGAGYSGQVGGDSPLDLHCGSESSCVCWRHAWELVRLPATDASPSSNSGGRGSGSGSRSAATTGLAACEPEGGDVAAATAAAKRLELALVAERTRVPVQ